MISLSGRSAVPRPGTAHPAAGLNLVRGTKISVTRVLIADDHPLVRDGLRTIMAVSFDDCDVHEAASIAEGIETIERNGEFDLVLLDLHMPDIGGFEGLTKIRDRFPSLPVVIVSGTSERSLIRGAIEHGASGFIPKSLRRSAIVAAIRSILAGDIFVPEDYLEQSGTDSEESRILERIETLTPQQKVVLSLVVAGKLNKQIAYDLDVSMTTVKAHVSAILLKLDVYSRTQAVIMANKVGFQPYEGPKPH
jgi:DNA-binding NarL/FixJ family response regulator